VRWTTTPVHHRAVRRWAFCSAAEAVQHTDTTHYHHLSLAATPILVSCLDSLAPWLPRRQLLPLVVCYPTVYANVGCCLSVRLSSFSVTSGCYTRTVKCLITPTACSKARLYLVEYLREIGIGSPNACWLGKINDFWEIARCVFRKVWKKFRKNIGSQKYVQAQTYGWYSADY